MTWVKICGITNLEDAQTAVDAGADALGFVFYEKSPRKVDPETVREIVKRLPPSIEKIGVFVNEPGERITGIVNHAGLTAIQLHVKMLSPGGKTPARLELSANVRTYVALPATSFFDTGGSKGFAWPLDKNRSSNRAVSAIFLDSGTPQRPGGTGQVFDWMKAVPLVHATGVAGLRIVVAGGLTPANVTEVMRILKPWGVDVASGVEATPGKKDPEKVRAFIATVRDADQEAQ